MPDSHGRAHATAKQTPKSRILPCEHPTATVFLDEAGFIARDRFFAVGCLKLSEPSVLLRKIQKLRDERQAYFEIHFKNATRGTLPFYRDVVDLVAASDGSFSCFVVDRRAADPVARFGSHWLAYEKLSQQLLLGTIRPRELLVVLADNYSTPAEISFERDVRAAVNKRLKRLAVVSVCRLDSKTTDALQVADLLTSAVAHEFRQAAGVASKDNAKAVLAKYVRNQFGVKSCLEGCREDRLNVALYGEDRPSSSTSRKRRRGTRS